MNRWNRVVCVALVVLSIAAAGCRSGNEVADPAARSSRDIRTVSAPLPDVGDLAYGPHDAQRLDVYRSTAGSPKGTLVFVHGGGWVGGDRSDLATHGEYAAVMDQRRAGWSVVGVGYPLGVDRSVEQVRSVSDAVEWLRRNARRLGINTKRIVLVGHSAGGTLVTTVAVAANDPGSPFGPLARVDGYIAIAAPLDFTLPDPVTDRLRANYLGRPKADGRAVSPTSYVDGRDPAGYLIHGDQDGMVPLAHSEQLSNRTRLAFDKVDVDATGRPLPDGCRNHLPMCGANIEALGDWLRKR